MRNHEGILFIGLFTIIAFISCEKTDDSDYPISDVKIMKITTEVTNNISSISFEYDNNGLIIKGTHSGGNYFSYDYDSINRLIRSNSYDSSGLYHYFTFQYDSNTITRIRYQYYPYTDSWGGDSEKSVYCYNSENQCEQIDYYTKNDNEIWIKSDYYTLCSWTKGNMSKLIHFNGDNIDYTETYQYDNKSNPEKLLNYMISPWTKSKNNPISSSTSYTDGRETHSTFKYSYNKYGYPVKKDRIDGVGTYTEKYEYEIK